MSDLMAALRASLAPCPSCPHPVRAHSREPGVGCLHVVHPQRFTRMPGTPCTCTEPGDSPADQ